MNINKLYKIIIDRQNNLPCNSYTTSLFKDGKDRIIQKVGEEAIETIISAKNSSKSRIISEISDLIFHLLVMMVYLKIKPKDIFEELEKRNNSKN
jgi:phosphoribosyl-ATP pyrophosphohydrolase